MGNLKIEWSGNGERVKVTLPDYVEVVLAIEEYVPDRLFVIITLAAYGDMAATYMVADWLHVRHKLSLWFGEEHLDTIESEVRKLK